MFLWLWHCVKTAICGREVDLGFSPYYHSLSDSPLLWILSIHSPKSRSLPTSYSIHPSTLKLFPFWILQESSSTLACHLSLTHIWPYDVSCSDRISWHLHLVLLFNFCPVNILYCKQKKCLDRKKLLYLYLQLSRSQKRFSPHHQAILWIPAGCAVIHLSSDIIYLETA